MKTKLPSFVILAIVALLVFVAVGYAGGTPPDKLLTPKNTVKCNVQVGNPIGIPLIREGDFKINSVSCVKGPSCSLDFPNFQLGIISDKGSVVLLTDDASDVKQIDVVEGTNVNVGLEICTADNMGLARLINENGAMIEEKLWKVQQ